MHCRRLRPWHGLLCLLPLLCWAALEGCQMLSDRLSRWKMLDQTALADPIKAVGGDGVVFAPGGDDRPLTTRQLADATPQQLVAFYSPIFVQQRVDTRAAPHPYPPEYDLIGEAHLDREKDGTLKSVVSGQPRIYALYQKVPIEGREHVQLTYTAWYPAHPKMKVFDVEAADVDSCVVRVTLDTAQTPLFYETIAACGCFHKVFVDQAIEQAALKQFGGPEKGKTYTVERTVKDAIDWEVAAIVDESREQPRRPVVFIKAGNHRVIGMGSASRLRVPPQAEVHPYTLVEYSELYDLPVAGTQERAAFFDMGHGGKVRGAQRKERFIFTVLGVDDAGSPRANDQIKLHFDQSTWSDPTIYNRFLRLPAGTL